MSGGHLHYSISPLAETLHDLVAVAVITAREARQKKAQRPPATGFAARSTLRPSEETPLWNELRTRIVKLTEPRGQKTLLARQMGLPRQRVHKFLREGSAMPDAERTLWLLTWVSAKEQGREIPL